MSDSGQIRPTEKQKQLGRANAALRIGLREAREAFAKEGMEDDAEAVTRALRRSERVEGNG